MFWSFMLRLFILFLFTLPAAHAQMMQNQVDAAPKKFSGFIQAGISSNAYEFGSVDNETGSSATVMFNYKLAGKNSLRTMLSGTKELTNTRESQFVGGWVGLHRSGVINTDYMSSALQLRILAPLSENDRKNTARTSGVSTVLLSPIQISKLGMTNSSLMWIANFTKNINEFETRADGEPNTEFQLSNTLVYSYSLSDKIGINLTATHVKARNYFGRILDDTYEFSQDLSYSVSANLTLGVGHSNGGQIINNQIGADREIEVFDERTSSYYVYLFYTF
jgi:hypothetical protein